MKRFSVITLLLILLCSSPFVSAHEDTFTLRFSGAFSLKLPLSFFKNSTILKSYDLSVVLPDKSSFTTQLITPELESLDPAFDMQHYPQYLFETAAPTQLPEQMIQRFKNSAEEPKADLGNFTLKNSLTIIRPSISLKALTNLSHS